MSCRRQLARKAAPAGNASRTAASQPRRGRMNNCNPQRLRMGVSLFILATALAGLVGCVVAPAPPAPSTSQAPTETDMSFEAISKRYLDEMMALTPVN